LNVHYLPHEVEGCSFLGTLRIYLGRDCEDKCIKHLSNTVVKTS
jgi:hypothetical protein